MTTARPQSRAPQITSASLSQPPPQSAQPAAAGHKRPLLPSPPAVSRNPAPTRHNPAPRLCHLLQQRPQSAETPPQRDIILRRDAIYYNPRPSQQKQRYIITTTPRLRLLQPRRSQSYGVPGLHGHPNAPYFHPRPRQQS